MKKIEIINVVVFFGGSFVILFAPGFPAEWYAKALAPLCAFVAGMGFMALLRPEAKK